MTVHMRAGSRKKVDLPPGDLAVFNKYDPKVIYLSKVLTERFSILYKTQTKDDIRFYFLTVVLVDIHFTFSAKVWIQL